MSMTVHKPNATSIDDVAQLLSSIVDGGSNSQQAHELIDGMSQLLWAVSDLDPDAESLLKHSRYLVDFGAGNSG